MFEICEMPPLEPHILGHCEMPPPEPQIFDICEMPLTLAAYVRLLETRNCVRAWKIQFAKDLADAASRARKPPRDQEPLEPHMSEICEMPPLEPHIFENCEMPPLEPQVFEICETPLSVHTSDLEGNSAPLQQCAFT